MMNIVIYIVPIIISSIVYFIIRYFKVATWIRIPIPAIAAISLDYVILHGLYNDFQLGPFIDVALGLSFLLSLGAVALLDAKFRAGKS